MKKMIYHTLCMLLLGSAYPLYAQLPASDRQDKKDDFPAELMLTQALLVPESAPGNGIKARAESQQHTFFARKTLQTEGEIMLEGGIGHEFRAGEAIVLNPGFTVDENTEFTAVIDAEAPEMEAIPEEQITVEKTESAPGLETPTDVSTVMNEFGPLDETLDQSAVLGQNVPNPFSISTSIRYQIPGNFSQALLSVTSMAGQSIVNVSLSQSQGEVMFEAGTLSKGIYIYQLWVDGRLIDSKRMIINK